MLSFLVILFAMMIVVPVSKRLGLSSVLGYLIAGALIGPQGLSLLGENFTATSELAELGVIMMLLLIGLELSPKLMWKLRGPIFGLGGLQVVGTTLLFAGILYAMQTRWQTDLVVGMILAGSSTAIVIQTLKGRGYAKSTGGERAFAVLLFQDIAVIAILAILPLLGASIHFDLIAAKPAEVAVWVLGIIALKGLLIYFIGRNARMRPPESLLFAFALAQGGEFAFVLIGQAGSLLSPELGQILTASVALTMAVTPLLIGLTITHGLSRFGIRSYFGDGANLDLLRAAGIENAKALVLAIDEPLTALKIAEELKLFYPQLPVLSRAYDRVHAYKLLHQGVKEVAIETSGSALALSVEVIKTLGVPPSLASRLAVAFKTNNDQSIRDPAVKFHEQDQESYIQSVKQTAEQLETLLLSDPEKLRENQTASL